MKTKIINSQLSNFKTYQSDFRQMVTLAENVFEFEGLPDFIDVAYMNKQLLRRGSVAFSKDEELGVIALPYRNIGKLDVYGRPNKIEVFAYNNSYHRILDRNQYVIMYDNNGRYPLYLDIAQIAERIALCERTQDINIAQQKTPRVWKASPDSLTTIRGMLNNIDSNVDSVVAHESAATIDDLECVLQPAPYVTDKIDLHLDKLWAKFFRLIGIANIQEQKRERVIQDEMIASQGGTIASRYSRFQPRKNAIDQINKKFNTNISVKYYDGIPDMMKGDLEDVSDDMDISDANSESV